MRLVRLRQIIVESVRRERLRGLEVQVISAMLRLGASSSAAEVVPSDLLSQVVQSPVGLRRAVGSSESSAEPSCTECPSNSELCSCFFSLGFFYSEGSHQSPSPAPGCCYECGELGHMRRKCPRLRRRQSHRRDHPHLLLLFLQHPLSQLGVEAR